MHMFYRVMKGIYQFAANLLSYIPTKYYWNRSTSDLVIAKSKRVNFFLKHSVVVVVLHVLLYRNKNITYRINMASLKSDPGFEFRFLCWSRFRSRCLPHPSQNVVDSLRHLVGISHFAECCENQPVTVWEMLTRNLSVDEVGKRYRLNHITIVKLYHPYTHFPCNIRLCHQRITTFLEHLWLHLINNLTYSLRSFLLIISTAVL